MRNSINIFNYFWVSCVFCFPWIKLLVWPVIPSKDLWSFPKHWINSFKCLLSFRKLATRPWLLSNHCDYFGVIIISTSEATHKTRVIELRQKYIEPKLLLSFIFVGQISIKKEAINASFRSPLNYFWYVLPL